ncbi:class I tRNA ligase family protein [Patescibacteria group bacterium]
MKNKFVQNEEDILKFWEKNKTFEKSVQKKAPKGDYVFYDGPPFATGLPHYGHIVASLMKDVVPRYWTMKGYKVERKWGWDCHGLPVENIAEKELKIKNKKDIEKNGVKNFNEECRGLVLRYADEWKTVIQRIGRWVDMENDYKTMEADYMESIWWVFKSLWDKKLIYKGHNSMHICPRCGTPLSNFEVSQNYQDIKDLSVIAKFELEDEPETYILAWTTTPWTLPGNVALAMGAKIDYVKIKNLKDNKHYILANANLEQLFATDEYKVEQILHAEDLTGKKYKPLFDYFIKTDLENKENLYTIQTANFVMVGEGTGIVHIAPAFGEDDMNIGKEKKLPMIQHVSPNGKFTDDIKEWANETVKPKEDTQATDKKIVDYLDKKGLIFKSEEFEHSYPLCWRCDTPLLNYATDSWFVKVAEIKDKMIANNEKMNWMPKHIKYGRFGKWLENARDWAISRERYWGAPLPVWECDKCEETEVIGDIKTLEDKALKNGKVYFIRHGEADNNVNQTLNSKTDDDINITEKGIEEIKKSANELKDKKIDIIISSDINRSVQSAEILSKELGLEIQYDKRLREVNIGDWNGDLMEDHKDFINKWRAGELVTYPNGENWLDAKKRIKLFYNDLLRDYGNKNILLVSHGDLSVAFESILKSKNFLQSIKEKFSSCKKLSENNHKNAEIKIYDHKIIDLHKHNIDSLKWKCDKCDGEMKRIDSVVDCWFESGSMPYAQNHYPYENKEKFEQNFPAQFIAEGIDQTRGWFYTLLVLSSALFDKPPALNVIVNGIVLAEDGQKMAKSKKNYPDPMKIIDEYGVDPLRHYLLSSPVMSAEGLNFSEKGVKESLQKTVMLISNILSFYKMYEEKTSVNEKIDSSNVLDKWIIAMLNKLNATVEKSMDNYNLQEASRPIEKFINDFSTWYLRRSRDRFKGDDEKDKECALQTTKYVLIELSKIIAPFMPFISEQVWQETTGYNFKNPDKSVHLEEWAKAGEIDKNILEKMALVRQIAEQGLSARAEAGIKVRQPLQAYCTSLTDSLEPAYISMLQEELNVLEIKFGEDKLSLKLTPELIREGMARELIRQINNLRKNQGLTINDRVKIYYQTNSEDIKNTLSKLGEQIKKDTLADELIFGDVLDGKEVKINGEVVRIGIERI